MADLTNTSSLPSTMMANGVVYNTSDILKQMQERIAQGKTPDLVAKSLLQLGFSDNDIKSIVGDTSLNAGKNLISSGAFATNAATSTEKDLAPVGSDLYNARLAAGLDAYGHPINAAVDVYGNVRPSTQPTSSMTSGLNTTEPLTAPLAAPSSVTTTSVAPSVTSPVTPTTNPYGVPLTNPISTSTSPYVKAAEATTSSNLAGAERATAANRVNQVTPYGNVNYAQTGVDAQGNPIWTATQTLAPEFQGAFGNIAKQITENTSQGFNPNLPSIGINPGETYSDAIMRRLQPQLERQSKSLETQLANQGIMPGSEAYNNAKTQLAQAQNDQLTSAIVGGFNTGLAANAQGYNQALTSYQLPFATLNQFRTGTAPSYVSPYNQPAVSGPDYLGAYTTGQNAELATNSANAAGKSNITSGLFNLAGTAIANPSAVSSIYNTAKGLFS